MINTLFLLKSNKAIKDDRVINLSNNVVAIKTTKLNTLQIKKIEKEHQLELLSTINLNLPEEKSSESLLNYLLNKYQVFGFYFKDDDCLPSFIFDEINSLVNNNDISGLEEFLYEVKEEWYKDVFKVKMHIGNTIEVVLTEKGYVAYDEAGEKDVVRILNEIIEKFNI